VTDIKNCKFLIRYDMCYNDSIGQADYLLLRLTVIEKEWEKGRIWREKISLLPRVTEAKPDPSQIVVILTNIRIDLAAAGIHIHIHIRILSCQSFLPLNIYHDGMIHQFYARR